MAKRKTKKTEIEPEITLPTVATPCIYCGKVRGIFLFYQDDEVGLSCPRCGNFGPRTKIKLDISDEMKWELAVKRWNRRVEPDKTDTKEAEELERSRML